MRATRRVVKVMGRHDFILETLMEIMECLFDVRTLKHVDIFDVYFISDGVEFDFQSRDTFKIVLFLCPPGVQQVINFLIVDLDVLNVDFICFVACSF